MVILNNFRTTLNKFIKDKYINGNMQIEPLFN